MKRILLIGQHGQVSTYLQKTLPAVAEVSVADRASLDLSKLDEIRASLDGFNADLIINPAAYTAVDKAEEETELAFRINRDAPAEIAKYCAQSNTPLIHFSTDYVFNGEAHSPYKEHQLPAPTGIYGASKLAGEQAILDSNADALILRTSWVYSNHGNNFYKTMLRLAETRNELSVVADQMGGPTFAGSIAAACSELAAQEIEAPGKIAQHKGVYHFTCHGETSWHGFASAIFRENGLDHISVQPISTSEFPTAAKRPAYSVLDNAKLQSVFGVSLPHWQEALADCASERAV